MKTTGIVLLILGSLSTIGALVANANGQQSNFSGLAIVVLGVYLINRANKKSEEEMKRKEWENKRED